MDERTGCRRRAWLRVALCAALLLPCAAEAAPPTAALSETTTVATVSGTGVPGFADGADATFLMPTGIAEDASGTMYVSDGAAQRIRRIARDGAVTTIAGGGALDASGLWVPGGYADGRGANARFDRPAGIAIRSDGTIYVADTLNHCIRAIDAHGDVTTYAGSPSQSGHVDGPRMLARFGDPTGLAVDRENDLYVADYTGIRKIDPAGNVTTVPGFGDRPYAVAVFDGPVGVTLFAGDLRGIVARLPGHAPSDDRAFARDGIAEGTTVKGTSAEEPLGQPAFLAALDPYTVAYTEARTNTVRELEIVSGQYTPLAGIRTESASGDSGGYADGPGPQAKFFAPLGIARTPEGGLLVADAGNRRIRSLTPTLRVDPWAAGDEAFPGIVDNPDPNEYRIAYVGNSYVYFVTDWATSIEGVLQTRLDADASLSATGKRAKVIPVIELANAPIRHFAEMCAQTGFYHAVVLSLNLGNVIATFENERKTPDLASPAWPGELTRTLQEIAKILGAKHIAFVVVVHPIPVALAPGEAAWYPVAKEFAPPYDMAPDVTDMRRLEDAVAGAGVPVVDMLPAFDAEERAPNHVPLFGTADYHFTTHARAMIGDAVAVRLHALAPWSLSPPK
ncbi:MAG TPA: SMP-30/gluconolactonase/LRE family protein [Candidatus Baltobacteraceae bacterium]|nr:SMP-30/gluconolactonase/LRE family protein [Candidatus Baltobacteraceae bacterium]